MHTTAKPKLIIIAGPTAVGKSAAAVSLAEKIGGEIVSADSMQVYRGMDIGTAKVTAEEMRSVPHHLIDVIEPTEDYNVVRFQQMASAAVRDILARGKIPILCGGTGFYIQALLYQIDFTEEPLGGADVLPAAGTADAGDAPAEKNGRLQGNSEGSSPQNLRERLLSEAQEADARGESGAALLHARLAAVDPESAAAIPAANQKRVIRALEFFELHGKKISEHNREQAERRKNAPFDYHFFVLTDERSKLYQRIDARVDRMFEAGLVGEVQALLAKGVSRSSTAMQGIGYREVAAALSGAYSMEEAREKIKLNSRHYAKRQLTWFRREAGVSWIDIGKTPDIVSEMLSKLADEKNMI